MTTVTTEEAKANLATLLEQVEAGEDVVIARSGRPIARLVRIEAANRIRRLGTWAGRVHFAPGWDDPMSDSELADWYEAPLCHEGVR
jgi:prevent-host-death family protein